MFNGHTPGPWYVSKHDDYRRVWKDYGDERVLIAATFDNWEDSYENARLIAAAPDLLAAANTALMHMIGYVNPTDAERELITVLRKALQVDDA